MSSQIAVVVLSDDVNQMLKRDLFNIALEYLESYYYYAYQT